MRQDRFNAARILFGRKSWQRKKAGMKKLLIAPVLAKATSSHPEKIAEALCIGRSSKRLLFLDKKDGEIA